MTNRSTSTVPARLARARRQLESWRRRPNRPARIPETLWSLAVELAGEHGVAPTARVLRLDYYSLKKRLEADAANANPSTAPSVGAFVEVLGSEFAPSAAECVLELEDARGTRMRLQLKGERRLEVAALVRTFLGDVPCSR